MSNKFGLPEIEEWNGLVTGLVSVSQLTWHSSIFINTEGNILHKQIALHSIVTIQPKHRWGSSLIHTGYENFPPCKVSQLAPIVTC